MKAVMVALAASLLVQSVLGQIVEVERRWRWGPAAGGPDYYTLEIRNRGDSDWLDWDPVLDVDGDVIKVPATQTEEVEGIQYLWQLIVTDSEAPYQLRIRAATEFMVGPWSDPGGPFSKPGPPFMERIRRF